MIAVDYPYFDYGNFVLITEATLSTISVLNAKPQKLWTYIVHTDGKLVSVCRFDVYTSGSRAVDNLFGSPLYRMVDSANQLHRARLLAASQPHTAAWLQAVPVPSLGLHLDEESVRVAVALRLGAAVCEQHRCRLCGRQVDKLGHHGLSCVKSAGRLTLT